jgi:hypothetical protein
VTDGFDRVCVFPSCLARRYGDPTTYPVKAKALFLSNDVFFVVNDTQVEIMRLYAFSDDVTSCVNVVRTVHHHRITAIY